MRPSYPRVASSKREKRCGRGHISWALAKFLDCVQSISAPKPVAPGLRQYVFHPGWRSSSRARKRGEVFCGISLSALMSRARALGPSTHGDAKGDSWLAAPADCARTAMVRAVRAVRPVRAARMVEMAGMVSRASAGATEEAHHRKLQWITRDYTTNYAGDCGRGSVAMCSGLLL